MSAYWILENVWAYSVQLAGVAACALVLARLGRRAAPLMRLALLQLGLLLALCAPFLMVQSGPAVAVPAFGLVTIEAAEAAPKTSRTVRPAALALGALGGGMALRLAWTLLGLAALGRRRRLSRLVTAERPEFLELRSRLNVEAELLAGPCGPVAFGFLRPAVLVPETLLGADAATLRAVLAHELIHLRRRDWLFVLAEELLTAALWFHPLVWLLVREIRLTREEVVDEQAAQAVSGAQPYLDALLAVARARFQPAHGLGAEFLRERQIARRITTLNQQENLMPRKLQYSLTSISVVALACAASWVATVSPLHAAPDRLQIDRVVQSERAIEKVRPMYPPEARRARVQGTVKLSIVVAEDGSVLSIDHAAGHPLLIPAAVEALKQWRYQPTLLNGNPIEVETTVDINFTLSK